MTMKQLPFLRGVHSGRLALALLCLGSLLSGCGRNDIRVYTVPKEQPSLAEAETGGQPEVHWKLPAGWEEREGDQMRLARFAVKGTNGEAADVSIIPLGEVATDKKMDLINIFRNQIQLPPAAPSELTNRPIAVGSGRGELYEMVSEKPVLDDKNARVLLAMLESENGVWLFKISGHDEFVAGQKPAFESFLKSISIEKSATPAVRRIASTNARRTPKPVGEETTNPAKPVWKVPSEWQEQSPGQINLAKWVVGSDSGGSAEVTVSAFPGDVGGLLANVNRWRGQVGLENISQSDLSSHVTPVDVPGGKAMLVDVTGSKNGQKARLIGAIVPREGRTWFFKLMGDEQVAEKQKSVFVKFVQTVQFPDA